MKQTMKGSRHELYFHQYRPSRRGRTEPKGVGVATLFLGKAGIVGFPPHVKTAYWQRQQRVLVRFYITQLGEWRKEWLCERKC